MKTVGTSVTSLSKCYNQREIINVASRSSSPLKQCSHLSEEVGSSGVERGATLSSLGIFDASEHSWWYLSCMSDMSRSRWRILALDLYSFSPNLEHSARPKNNSFIHTFLSQLT